jgi:hypothetical protein
MMFDRRMERIAGLVKTKHCPSLILECEMRLALYVYHGGRIRAALKVLRSAVQDTYLERKSLLAMWIADRMGWTKIYDIPETKDFIAHQQRHGRKCSGSPNCNNHRCIPESCPRWFRWLMLRGE